jgi:hypothetical protein
MRVIFGRPHTQLMRTMPARERTSARRRRRRSSANYLQRDKNLSDDERCLDDRHRE